MFVDITEPKKPLEAEKLFRACWRGKEDITPEICLEVLKSTNFATCIKRMLECVERLPEEKQAAFKEVVLATFDGREQPESVAKIGERLAVNGGYHNDLKPDVWDLFKKPREYIVSSPNGEVGKIFYDNDFLGETLSDYEQVMFVGLPVLDDCDAFAAHLNFEPCEKVMASDCDFRNVKEMKFKAGAEVTLDGSVNVPFSEDFKKCRFISFEEGDMRTFQDFKFIKGASLKFRAATHFPEVLALSDCDEVDFGKSDFFGVKQIKINNVRKLNFESVSHLPADIEINNCGTVIFDWCDMNRVENLKLWQVLGLKCHNAKLPDTLHLDDVGMVDFTGADMKNVHTLTFRDGAFGRFNGTFLPYCFDAEPFYKIELQAASFLGMRNLKFRDGARVDLRGAMCFPFQTDFSKCQAVDLRGTAVKYGNFLFADKRQLEACGGIFEPNCRVLFQTDRNAAAIKEFSKSMER